MKKVVNVILVMILLTITIIIGYEKENILIKQKNVNVGLPENAIEYDININKTNENSEPLSNVVFRITDINNIIEVIIPETTTPGNYYYNDYIQYDPNKVVDIHPNKEELQKLKTVEDIEKSTLDIDYGDTWCNVYATIPLILEEVQVPSGYVKEKYILLADTTVYYDIENNNLYYDYFYGRVKSLWYINYNDISDFNNFNEKLYNGDYDNLIQYTCQEKRIQLRTNDKSLQYSIALPSTLDCPFNIINKKGTIDLKINNFVNEKSNLITATNKTLKYQIKVENKGTASSTENTIITEVPKGLTYVENSASHDGEYNKNNHEIMWRIDEISAEETVELTYEATVPKDADPNMQYIGKTSINSRELTTEINSDETIVTIMDNPKTSNFINFIILILSGILVSGTYFTTIKKIN